MRDVLEDGDVVEAVVLGLPGSPPPSSLSPRGGASPSRGGSSGEDGTAEGVRAGGAAVAAAAEAEAEAEAEAGVGVDGGQRPSTPPPALKKAGLGLRERAASAVFRANQMVNAMAAAEVRGRAASVAAKPKGASLKWEAPPPPPPEDMTIDSPNTLEDRKHIASIEVFDMSDDSSGSGSEDEF